MQKKLSPQARKKLKKNYRLLGKRGDELSDKEYTLVQELIGYHSKLAQCYFVDWYDLNLDVKQASYMLQEWYKQSHAIQHKAVESYLQTLKNWEKEIMNYHRLRFTNAVVEGRHNKIKALQRRHYLTRNPNVFKQRILTDCNENYMSQP
ncbi:Transposase [Salibacterium halotolerans]|uniref:Transposase n=1 Tax=Salibacterium halotolerans TaxID=1884432 RepID=A0A1I5XZ08_9BACI|nr:Transposase [Salibacterium halotolerans]